MSAGLEALPRIEEAKQVVVDHRSAAPVRPSPAVAPSRPQARFEPPERTPAPSVGDRLREIHEFRQEDDSRSLLDQVVAETNDMLKLQSRSLRFRINENSEELQIQVIDADRDRVIRSIPSDEMIQLAMRMRNLSGVGAMVDHSR